MGYLKELGMGAGRALANGIIGNALGALFSPSRKKLMKEQKEAQMELNEQAAALNYLYGEKAAESAYARQLAMYRRSYEDQSYKAMRKQMEDAGLSVGLMYGGNGGSGGGVGSMTGAPMGATGGAQAGDAASVMGLALQYKRLQNETMLAQSQAAVNEAQANKLNTDSEDTKATREARINNYLSQIGVNEQQAKKLYQEGRAQWLNNLKVETLMEKTAEELREELQALGVEAVKNPDYGTTYLRYGAAWTKEYLAELDKTLKEGNRAEAAALFDSEKKNAIWEEIAIAWKNADANAMRAAAMKLAAEFETGEFVNWKTILGSGIEILGSAAGLAEKTTMAALMGTKTKGLNKMLNRR